MPNSVSNIFQKLKAVPKLEFEHFKLIFVRRKIMYLYLGPQIAKIYSPQIAKSANCHISGKAVNLTKN